MTALQNQPQMNANKTQFKNSFLQSGHWISGATVALASVVTAQVCFAVAPAGQQRSANTFSQQTSNPAIPKPAPESTPPTAPQQPEKSPNGTSTVSPSSIPALTPSSTVPGFIFPQLSDREIVVTAVGDVMLGTTFPDETGGLLPPNDGVDLLQQVHSHP